MSGEKNTFECVVSADLFRRALLGVSTEETRYYLNGVHVSPAAKGGATLVATNGSFLIALYDPAASVAGEGIVSLSKPMVAALKPSRRDDTERLLLVRGANKALVVAAPRDDAAALFDAPDQRVQATQHGDTLIDGSFPNWRRALPDTILPDAPIPPLNEGLLSLAAEALSQGKERFVQLTSSGPNGPILVNGGKVGFAIIMPIRTPPGAREVPSWAKMPLPEAA